MVAAGYNSATAQRTPTIWDVSIGTPIGGLPKREFVDPACGTDGGPPGLRLRSLMEFAKCGPDSRTGLREVWFRFDDELEYIARATRSDALIGQHMANQILGQPVMYSLLVDDDGLIQGYRVITDERAETLVRFEAASLAIHFKYRFGAEGWTCADMPPAEGETAIGNEFIKEVCERTVDGQRYVVETRYYFKPGQTLHDPHSRRPMVGEGEFESSARLETYREDAVRP